MSSGEATVLGKLPLLLLLFFIVWEFRRVEEYVMKWNGQRSGLCQLLKFSAPNSPFVYAVWIWC